MRTKPPEFDFQQDGDKAKELAEVLHKKMVQLNGAGLSANQVGLPYRVFVLGTPERRYAFFNPQIVGVSKEQVAMEEGCLSFPLLGLSITRAENILVEYQDFNGNVRQQNFGGISARCFQHELDHMNGIVYTSKVKPLALQQGQKKRNKIYKKLGLK